MPRAFKYLTETLCMWWSSLEYPNLKEIKHIYGDGGVHKMTGMESFVVLATTTDSLHFSVAKNVVAGVKGPNVVTPGGFKQVRHLWVWNTYQCFLNSFRPLATCLRLSKRRISRTQYRYVSHHYYT